VLATDVSELVPEHRQGHAQKLHTAHREGEGKEVQC